MVGSTAQVVPVAFSETLFELGASKQHLDYLFFAMEKTYSMVVNLAQLNAPKATQQHMWLQSLFSQDR